MKIFKSELLQQMVPNGTTQTRFYFPDNAVLRTDTQKVVKIKGLEFYPAEAVPLAPDGSAVIPAADINGAFVVLYIENGEYLKIPICKLISVHNNTSQAESAANYPYIVNLPELGDLMVNWPKSYVLFATTVGTTNTTILSTVYYDFYPRS